MLLDEIKKQRCYVAKRDRGAQHGICTAKVGVVPNRAVAAQLQRYYLFRQKKIESSVQYRVVEIDDLLGLAEPLRSELPEQSRIALPLAQHLGRAKLRRVQRANLVGLAFNRRPPGWQAGEELRISYRCNVREAGRRPVLSGA